MRRNVWLLIGSAALILLASRAGWAQQAVPAVAAPPKLDSGDTAWMLTSTGLVLLMTIPGLALFYGGLVRKKNVLSILMQAFTVCCLVTVLWFVVGYSLAFTDGGGLQPYIGGLAKSFFRGIGVDSLAVVPTAPPTALTIPESVFATFQMTFAIITPALITGAFADRMKFSALLWFMALWLLVVYCPVAHWVWGGGFLGGAGVLDFAGGTVVHINSGVAGLVAALMLGRRYGFGSESLAPHNLVISLIGASLLWVGWFGFNAGSASAASGLAGMAMAVTQIAAATAALTWMFAEWAVLGKPSVLGIISGAVAGLVAVTPASGFVAPAGAFCIGIAAGLVCFWAVVWLKNKLGYDDALDAFGIHGVGGMVGALLTGIFADPAINSTGTGLLYNNPGQLAVQAYGIVWTILWSAVASAVMLKAIDLLIGLRVTRDVEIEGLDLNLHGEIVP